MLKFDFQKDTMHIRNKIVITLGIFWFLYHLIIMAGGFCDYFIEEKYENEWYVYESDSEADGVGGNTYSQYAVDGPFNKYDAIQCLNKYRREAKEFRRNYGTIYNLIPEADINIIDGVRVTFSNHDIVHFRASGNAPEFRCYTESSTEDLAVSLNDFCKQLIVDLYLA